jgi:hypothetical protein
MKGQTGDSNQPVVIRACCLKGIQYQILNPFGLYIGLAVIIPGTRGSRQAPIAKTLSDADKISGQRAEKDVVNLYIQGTRPVEAAFPTQSI